MRWGVCWFTFSASFLCGQSAELSGLVKDPSGGVIRNAKVELRHRDTGIRQQTHTNG
jgi:hypothetical protein